MDCDFGQCGSLDGALAPTPNGAVPHIASTIEQPV
jgi:hypothetical protein